MKAIKTKYLGTTNTKGSRIKAVIDDGKGDRSLTVPYDHYNDAYHNHVLAAEALAKQLDWRLVFMTGELKDCFVHVILPNATLIKGAKK